MLAVIAPPGIARIADTFREGFKLQEIQRQTLGSFRTDIPILLGASPHASPPESKLNADIVPAENRIDALRGLRAELQALPGKRRVVAVNAVGARSRIDRRTAVRVLPAILPDDRLLALPAARRRRNEQQHRRRNLLIVTDHHLNNSLCSLQIQEESRRPGA
jgi:hypothetical protein